MQAQKLGGRWFARVFVVGCIALGLAACGRKSSLDPPPTAAVPPPAQAGEASQAAAGQSPDWRAPPQEEAAAPATSRNRGFILDPLLR